MKNFFVYLLAINLLFACKSKDNEPVSSETEATLTTSSDIPVPSTFQVDPISHATMILSWDDTTIYIDPVGGANAFEGKANPELILITDIHGDHLNVETLEALQTEGSKLIVPQAVADKLPEELKTITTIIANGEIIELLGFTVEAIPMYNLREEALKFHEKGRGNGYVIEKNGERVYISGDTEDIPEMRSLKNIDRAFVCMNLPYTMTVESAADAVLEFGPKEVFPYHYRGTEGFSDVAKFYELVKPNNNILVTLLDWYPENK